jgi:hypothetical protein
MVLSSGRIVLTTGPSARSRGRPDEHSGRTVLTSGRSDRHSGRAVLHLGRAGVRAGRSVLLHHRTGEVSGRIVLTSGRSDEVSGRSALTSGRSLRDRDPKSRGATTLIRHRDFIRRRWARVRLDDERMRHAEARRVELRGLGSGEFGRGRRAVTRRIEPFHTLLMGNGPRASLRRSGRRPEPMARYQPNSTPPVLPSPCGGEDQR